MGAMDLRPWEGLETGNSVRGVVVSAGLPSPISVSYTLQPLESRRMGPSLSDAASGGKRGQGSLQTSGCEWAGFLSPIAQEVPRGAQEPDNT